MVMKSTEKPRNAPKMAAKIQTMVSVRLMPKRSASRPAGSPTSIPASGSMPQMVPICTRLRLRSSAMRGKSTGMQRRAAPAIDPKVSIAMASMYQR